MIVYIRIRNSDDKLTQVEWSELCADMTELAADHAQVHAAFFSRPDASWQDACWCVNFTEPAEQARARDAARRLGGKYWRTVVAWDRVTEPELL
jgi:hypothetical protein